MFRWETAICFSFIILFVRWGQLSSMFKVTCLNSVLLMFLLYFSYWFHLATVQFSCFLSFFLCNLAILLYWVFPFHRISWILMDIHGLFCFHGYCVLGHNFFYMYVFFFLWQSILKWVTLVLNTTNKQVSAPEPPVLVYDWVLQCFTTEQNVLIRA